MAIRYELRTFKDIVDAVMEACQIQSTDAVERNRIKRNVQQVYFYEVLPYKRWQWLRGSTTVQTEPYFGTGNASVVSGSSVVALTDAPQASRRDYFFSVEGSNVKYRILDHQPGSLILTLSTPFGEATAPTARFKIWTEAVPLPPDLEEVIEVRNAQLIQPMRNLGLQEQRRLEATGPKSEGYPLYFTTTDYKVPEVYQSIPGLPASLSRYSSGNAKTIVFNGSLGTAEVNALLRPGDQIEVVVTGPEGYRYGGRSVVNRLFTTNTPNDSITYSQPVNWTEALTADATTVVRKLRPESYERYRELLIYPAIFNARTNLEVDYIKQAISLEADSDEPSMPMRDRIVLYYGALYHTWTRKANPDEAQAARMLFQSKLDKMAGKTEDSPDKPHLVPSKLYMGAKRAGNRMRSRRTDGIQFAGAGATTAPSGNPNQVGIFGPDGFLQSSAITTTELNTLSGIQGNIQQQINDLGVENPVGNRVVITSPGGPLDESPVTSTELRWLENVLKDEVVLQDDSSDVLTSVPLANHETFIVDYSIARGAGNREAGRIIVTSDGTSVAFSQGGVASVGDVGITFDAGVFGGDLELYWYSTSTGTPAKCAFRVQRLLTP